MGLKGFACGIAFSLFLAQGQAFAGKANDTLVYASDTEPENVSPYHNDAREGVILAHLAWDTLIYRAPRPANTSRCCHPLAAGRSADPRLRSAPGRDLPQRRSLHRR